MAIRVAGVAVGLSVAACGGRRPPPTTLVSAPAGRASTTAEASPELDGERILQRVCTACHDLGGLDAFAPYWGEPEWRSMIDTMISYGAELTAEEYEVLARYLAEHYGPVRDSVVGTSSWSRARTRS